MTTTPPPKQQGSNGAWDYAYGEGEDGAASRILAELTGDQSVKVSKLLRTSQGSAARKTRKVPEGVSMGPRS